MVEDIEKSIQYTESQTDCSIEANAQYHKSCESNKDVENIKNELDLSYVIICSVLIATLIVILSLQAWKWYQSKKLAALNN